MLKFVSSGYEDFLGIKAPNSSFNAPKASANAITNPRAGTDTNKSNCIA